ncbi:MAG: SusC/RagA family TonB-linked outer membrane protein, partial [Bacteroidia bacterium]|nr:SusC/RagA family TonB-linked outer membrane protein [Bacteroidia bacterium]
MRLTAFLIFLSMAQVFAVSSYSQATRLSLDLKNVAVKNVLLEIENNSEFYFIYSNKLIDVDRKVSVKMDNKKVEEILDHIFQDEHVNYSISDRQIILSPEGLSVGRSGDIFQQAKKVTGKVTSENGESLPGVTVMVKGTMTGTVTD